MAVAIVATAGSASANSFVTLVEADAYVEGRLNASTWEDDASTDAKNRALVEATRWLTRLAWIGLRADDTQALSWPRQDAINPDSPVADYYDVDEIPDRVKDATAELAFQFIKAGTTDVAALNDSRNIRRSKVDVLETEYFAPSRQAKGLSLYPSVVRHIAPLLVGGGLTTRTVRG